MVFHGSSEFGKAYQEELRRIAGVSDELESEGLKLSRSREPRILSRLLGRLSNRRREIQRASPAPLKKPHRTLGGSRISGEV